MPPRVLLALAVLNLTLSACDTSDDLAAEFDARDEQIAELQAQLDTLKARLDVLDPQQASERLLAAEQALVQVQVDVDALAVEDSRLGNQVLDQERRIAGLEDGLGGRVGVLEGSSAEQGTRIGVIEDWRSAQVDPGLAAVDSRAADLEVWRADVADPAFVALDSRADALGAAVAANTTDIAGLATRTTGLALDLASLADDLDEQGLAITTLEADLAALEGRLDTCELELDALDLRVDAHDDEVASLDRVNTVLKREVDDLWAKTADLQTQVYDLDADVRVAAADVKDLEAIEAGRWITKDTTWTIGSGGDYPTVEKAWEAALCVRIIPAATLTLKLLPGTHTLADVWDLTHPDGSSIRILGDRTDVSKVSVAAASGKAGLTLGTGQAIREVAGLTLTGTGGSGVVVRHGSALALDVVAISGFSGGACIDVYDGATVVIADGGVDASTCGVGLRAAWGSVVRAPGATIADSKAQGVYAFYGSVVDVTDAAIDRSGASGASAAFTSTVVADDAVIKTTGDAGLQANYASVVGGSGASVDKAKQFSFEMGFASVGVLMDSASSNPGWNHYYAGYLGVFRAERASGGTGVTSSATANWTF
jgi:cell division protein FtsB